MNPAAVFERRKATILALEMACARFPCAVLADLKDALVGLDNGHASELFEPIPTLGDPIHFPKDRDEIKAAAAAAIQRAAQLGEKTDAFAARLAAALADAGFYSPNRRATKNSGAYTSRALRNWREEHLCSSSGDIWLKMCFDDWLGYLSGHTANDMHQPRHRSGPKTARPAQFWKITV